MYAGVIAGGRGRGGAELGSLLVAVVADFGASLSPLQFRKGRPLLRKYAILQIFFSCNFRKLQSPD